MRRLVFALGSAIFASAAAYADEVGRYQAIAIAKIAESDPTTVFILDTKEGHMWMSTEYSVIPGVREGGRWLVYHGRVRPGTKIGDVIEKQQFTIPANK